MSRVKEAIEEVIEESYLRGLSDEEIRSDFKRFIDTCFSVLQSNVKDRESIGALTEELAREKTCTLIADHAHDSQIDTAVAGASGVSDETQEVFAEKVARRKRLILKAIADYDPDLVRLIDAQRFQGDGSQETTGRIKKARNWEQHRLLFLKWGYAATVALIVLLIYLGIKPSL
jgi:hypothetical protein